MKLKYSLTPYTKINSKCIKDQNVRLHGKSQDLRSWREEGRQGVQDGAETVFTHMLPVGMSNERATF